MYLYDFPFPVGKINLKEGKALEMLSLIRDCSLRKYSLSFGPNVGLRETEWHFLSDTEHVGSHTTLKFLCHKCRFSCILRVVCHPAASMFSPRRSDTARAVPCPPHRTASHRHSPILSRPSEQQCYLSWPRPWLSSRDLLLNFHLSVL